MKDSKLIQLIKTLNKEEVRVFGNYLEWAGIRKKGSIFAFYKYLKNLQAQYTECNLKKEVVYKEILTADKAYNEKRMRDLMSILTLHLENYLITKELEKSNVEREFLLLKVLKERQQDKLFFQKIKQLQRKWKKNPPKGIIKYHYDYLLQKELYAHPNFSGYAETQASLHNLMEKIDHYYFASKLYCTVNVLQMQYHLNPPDGEQPIALIEEINQYSKQTNYSKNPHIDIFKHFFHAHTHKDYSNYDALKNLYITQIDNFDDTEKYDLFNFLQNYCYLNYQQGKKEYLQEVFELNKFAVEQKIVLEANMIANDIFRNIVGTGCIVAEFEWTHNFINNYKCYLDKSNQIDIVLLCEATLSFYQSDFEMCLEKLLSVKFQDVVYAVQVRLLKIQCYYELTGYEDAFYNLAHAFSTFLYRNKDISPTFKESNLNFIQFLKKLHKAKNHPVQPKDNLKVILQEHKNIMNKNWLTKKVIELY